MRSYLHFANFLLHAAIFDATLLQYFQGQRQHPLLQHRQLTDCPILEHHPCCLANLQMFLLICRVHSCHQNRSFSRREQCTQMLCKSRFPEPFAPSTATKSPGCTCIETSFNAGITSITSPSLSLRKYSNPTFFAWIKPINPFPFSHCRCPSQHIPNNAFRILSIILPWNSQIVKPANVLPQRINPPPR